ncbi:MAG: hypothetical protein JXB00_15365 [Bacteroidales bacterium]|nr:hypothetical protein [Bacteroidales bacterium]
MKPLKLFFLLLTGMVFIINIPGQELPLNSSSNKIEYQGVNEYVNSNQAMIYHLAKEWLLINDLIILLEDSASTRILAEKMFKSRYPGSGGFFDYDPPRERGIRFNVTLEFRDNKIRYTIGNFKILKIKEAYTYTVKIDYQPYYIQKDEDEIIINDAEDYYPVDKCDEDQRKAYAYFFNEIEKKISALVQNLNSYFARETNW